MDSLPIDVLQNIVELLSVTDISTFRKLSRCCNEATYGKSLWNKVYKRSRLPRPPGPFPHQSSELLEALMARSVRLSRRWPPSPIKDTTNRLMQLVHHRGASRYATLLLGRWYMITCAEGITCYDLDRGEPTHSPYIVYRSALPIYRLMCASTQGEGGEHIAFAVIKETTRDRSLMFVKVFRIETTSGHVSLTQIAEFDYHIRHDMRFVALSWRWLILGSDSNPPYTIVIDVQTSSSYQIYPQLAPEIAPWQGWLQGPLNHKEYLPISSYILVVYTTRRMNPPTCPGSFLQAFTGPTTPAGQLNLTHEGTCQNMLMNCKILSGPTTDVLSAVTRVTILAQEAEPNRFTFIIAQITLNSSGQIDTTVQRLFSYDNCLIHACTTSFLDGYARGVCYSFNNQTPQAIAYTIYPDDNGREYHVDTMDIDLPGFNYGAITSYPPFFFDGDGGRLCYRSSTDFRGYSIQVVDFVDPSSTSTAIQKHYLIG